MDFQKIPLMLKLKHIASSCIGIDTVIIFKNFDLFIVGNMLLVTICQKTRCKTLKVLIFYWIQMTSEFT